ncbi:TetR/AcrR family transcriptional regulator [Corynebacterium sp. A21]|uniref:TetR/AcrR family transcriptional regulator n=1 Tax=Corynebacterium sp. A21 TaxID=3457318 RepID=UPI003FCF39C2
MQAPHFDAPTGRLAEIIDTARDLLEVHDWPKLSTRMLADTLGIKAPSLYKHVRHKEDIAAHLATAAFIELGGALHRSLESGGGAVELLAEYRRRAKSQPHLYRLLTGTGFPREQLPEGLEEWAGTPFFLAAGQDPIRGQALWAFAHGMAILEIDGRFAGPDGDSPAVGAWEAGAQALGEAPRD